MFRDYLARLIEKNPALAKPETVMRITVASFVAQLERAYEAALAEKDGRELFDELFGGMRK